MPENNVYVPFRGLGAGDPIDRARLLAGAIGDCARDELRKRPRDEQWIYALVRQAAHWGLIALGDAR